MKTRANQSKADSLLSIYSSKENADSKQRIKLSFEELDILFREANSIIVDDILNLITVEINRYAIEDGGEQSKYQIKNFFDFCEIFNLTSKYFEVFEIENKKFIKKIHADFAIEIDENDSIKVLTETEFKEIKQ